MESGGFLGTFRCVKGQGMINMRSHETGDLIVQFDVEFPGEKSLEGAELFKVNSQSNIDNIFLHSLNRNSNQSYQNVLILTFPMVKMSKKFK